MHVTVHDRVSGAAERSAASRRVTLLVTGVSFILILFFYSSVYRSTRVETVSETEKPHVSTMASSMFSHNQHSLSSTVTKYSNFESHLEEKKILTFLDFFLALQTKSHFSEYFIELLKSSKYKAFFFECPALTIVNLAKPLEFVLTESSRLASVTKPNLDAFAENFQAEGSSQSSVVVFSNLGKDATLVAPVPEDNTKRMSKYIHLAVFLRESTMHDSQELFSEVAKTALDKIQAQTGVPLWLSTSGTGIFWLHVRLDSRPKYYTYSKYIDKNYLTWARHMYQAVDRSNQVTRQILGGVGTDWMRKGRFTNCNVIGWWVVLNGRLSATCSRGC